MFIALVAQRAFTVCDAFIMDYVLCDNAIVATLTCVAFLNELFWSRPQCNAVKWDLAVPSSGTGVLCGTVLSWCRIAACFQSLPVTSSGYVVQDQLSEVGGSTPKVPRPGIQAQRPGTRTARTARTARKTRQINGA